MTLVRKLSTAELADAFLIGKARHCAPSTIRKYRWALMCLERVYPVLPRVTIEIVGFVQAEPLRPGSRRVLYDTLRDFHRWIKANNEPLLPELPYVWFSSRKKKRRRKEDYD